MAERTGKYRGLISEIRGRIGADTARDRVSGTASRESPGLYRQRSDPAHILGFTSGPACL